MRAFRGRSQGQRWRQRCNEPLIFKRVLSNDLKTVSPPPPPSGQLANKFLVSNERKLLNRPVRRKNEPPSEFRGLLLSSNRIRADLDG